MDNKNQKPFKYLVICQKQHSFPQKWVIRFSIPLKTLYLPMLTSDLTINLNRKAHLNIYIWKVHCEIAWSLHSPYIHKAMASNYLAREQALLRCSRYRVMSKVARDESANEASCWEAWHEECETLILSGLSRSPTALIVPRREPGLRLRIT